MRSTSSRCSEAIRRGFTPPCITSRTAKKHNHKSTREIPDASKGYHIYAVDWQPEKVSWYVDGIEVWSFSDHDIPSTPLWMVLNTAVGGKWSGMPDETTVFPQEFIVDYVRVYEKL